MSASEVAAVCSMILAGITVTDFGVSTSGAVNLLDEGSATRLASMVTDETDRSSALAVVTAASALSGPATAAWARPSPATPATAAILKARRGRLTTPVKFGLRIVVLSPGGAASRPLLKLRGVLICVAAPSQ